MVEPFIFIGTHTIKEGKLEDFERMAAVGRECGIEFLPPPEPNDRGQA